MKENSYVIARQKKDEKPFLARIAKIKSDGTFIATLEKDIQFKQTQVTLDKKQIKVNLGVSPMPGKAYGCDLDNLFKKTISHDFWGNVHFFVTLEDEYRKRLKKSLDRTAKIVEKLKLSDYTKTFETEIRAKKGKYAGMFVPSKDSERVHRIWYAPEHAGTDEFMDYVVLHELGHAIRHVGVRAHKMRNRWLRLYQRTIAPVQISAATCETLLTDMAEYDEQEKGFSSVFKQLADEVGPRTAKAILQWFKQTHKIGPRELEIMWRSSKTKDLEKYWPNVEVDTHDLKPVISEYATKNVEELFAETFAFYAQGKKLPEKFQDLMEESLSIARAELRG